MWYSVGHSDPLSRDGDLQNGTQAESTVLHRFMIPTQPRFRQAFQLNARLNLGVGEQGVIGRRVSLLDGSVVAAEGILGWN